MSNYITIESGNFLPFKENETDPELKIWADKYLEIFNKIHETLLPYETSDFFPAFSRYTDLCREEKECQVWDFYHSREREKIREEKREMLRQWTYRLPGDKSLSELKEELRECLLHRVWKGYKSLLINESNIINVELDGGCLVVGTGVLNTKIYGFEAYSTAYRPSIKSVVDSSLSAEFLDAFFNTECRSIYCSCSIQEAYKNFQLNNVEKIKKDKIKCGSFKTENVNHGISVRT